MLGNLKIKHCSIFYLVALFLIANVGLYEIVEAAESRKIAIANVAAYSDIPKLNWHSVTVDALPYPPQKLNKIYIELVEPSFKGALKKIKKSSNKTDLQNYAIMLLSYSEMGEKYYEWSLLSIYGRKINRYPIAKLEAAKTPYRTVLTDKDFNKILTKESKKKKDKDNKVNSKATLKPKATHRSINKKEGESLLEAMKRMHKQPRVVARVNPLSRYAKFDEIPANPSTRETASLEKARKMLKSLKLSYDLNHNQAYQASATKNKTKLVKQQNTTQAVTPNKTISAATTTQEKLVKTTSALENQAAKPKLADSKLLSSSNDKAHMNSHESELKKIKKEIIESLGYNVPDLKLELEIDENGNGTFAYYLPLIKSPIYTGTFVEQKISKIELHELSSEDYIPAILKIINKLSIKRFKTSRSVTKAYKKRKVIIKVAKYFNNNTLKQGLIEADAILTKACQLRARLDLAYEDIRKQKQKNDYKKAYNIAQSINLRNGPGEKLRQDYIKKMEKLAALGAKLVKK